MRSSRTLFDMADLNPLGNPLTSMDEDFDEITGLPRSIADSLMGVPSLRNKKRYPWDENPNPMEGEMGMPPGVPAPAPGAGSTIPLGPPEPSMPQPQQQAQPQQQQKGGWRNALRAVAGYVGDGLVGASTPNIAYGGGQDIIRAGAGGWGAHQSRIDKQRQRELEAERRKAEAEKRKVDAEDRLRRIKLEEEKAEGDKIFRQHQLETDKMQRDAAAKAAAAADRTSKYANIKTLPDGTIVNLDTHEVIRPDPPDLVEARRKQFEKQFKETGDPFWDPKSKDNQRRILLGDKPDPLAPKADGSLTPEEVILRNESPEAVARAWDLLNKKRDHEKTVASIRKASDDGTISPNEAVRMTNAAQQVEAQAESARTRAFNTWMVQSTRINPDNYPTSKARKEAQDKIDKALEDEYKRIDAAAAPRQEQVKSDLSKIGSRAKGGGTPAIPPPTTPPVVAPPQAAAPATPTRRQGTDKRTGQKIWLELVNGQWQPVR